MTKIQRRDLKLDPTYTVSLRSEGQNIISELEAQMLRAIDQTGSFSEAARTLSLSYAFVWNTISRIERHLEKRIVIAEQGGVKGGRTQLTTDGRKLLQAYIELDSRVRRIITGSISNESRPKTLKEAHPNLSFVGSHCIIVEKVLEELHADDPRVTPRILNVGSWGGIAAMMLKQADIAGIHLLDQATSKYNQPFLSKLGLSQSCALIRGYKREQCLMVRKGNPKEINGISDLIRNNVKLVNRNLGSGTRILLDNKLHKLARTRRLDFDTLTKRIRGYTSEMMTHRQVAAAVSSRRADVGIGLSLIAAEMKLDIIPIGEESYDFLVEKRLRNPYVREFFHILRSKEFQRKTIVIRGIDFLDQTGCVVK